MAELVGKHKAGFFPHCTYSQPPLCLAPVLCFQRIHHCRGRGDTTAFTVLGRNQLILASLPISLELLVDMDAPFVKVNTIPGEPKHFTLPHTREQGNKINKFIFVPSNHSQESAYRIVIKRFDFGLFNSGQLTGSGRIFVDVAQLNSLLQRLVEYAVYIANRFGRKRWGALALPL